MIQTQSKCANSPPPKRRRADRGRLEPHEVPGPASYRDGLTPHRRSQPSLGRQCRANGSRCTLSGHFGGGSARHSLVQGELRVGKRAVNDRAEPCSLNTAYSWARVAEPRRPVATTMPSSPWPATGQSLLHLRKSWAGCTHKTSWRPKSFLPGISLHLHQVLSNQPVY